VRPTTHTSGSFVELRLGDLSRDVFDAGNEAPDPSREWPTPGYAEAARACGGDREAIEKLRLLCEDLETSIQLKPGPGSLIRVAAVPIDILQPLENRCWREVLLDDSIGRLAWVGVRNYARALKSREMDSTTRRTGRVIHCVAVLRLEELGEIEEGADRRKRNRAERKALMSKAYLPKPIARLISGP
jgi:hypothetical protein